MISNKYFGTSCKTHSLILVLFRSWTSLLQLPPVLHVLSIMHPILFSKYAAFSIITPFDSFVSFFKAPNACHPRERFLWFYKMLFYLPILIISLINLFMFQVYFTAYYVIRIYTHTEIFIYTRRNSLTLYLISLVI
jgi:hypothetical protein